MIRVLSQFRRLLALCLRGQNGKATLLLLGVVVALKLGSIYFGVQLIEWTGNFWSALENTDAPEAIRQLVECSPFHRTDRLV